MRTVRSWFARIKRGSAAVRSSPRSGLGAPLARTRIEAATQVIRRPIPASRLSGVGRNPSRALRVAFGDGLRPLPTEPAR